MNRRFLLAARVLLMGARLAVASRTAKEGTWTGIVTDTITGAADSDPERVTNSVREHGALYALVESKSHKVYVLNPQNAAAPYAGRAVVVKGTMDNPTITITASSITAAPAKNGK